MDDQDLGHRLDQLICDEPPPVAPWDDLARGRAARRRRRATATVGALSLVACAAAAAVWVSALPASSTGPATGSPPVRSWPTPTYVNEEPKVPTSYAAPAQNPSPTAPEYVPERVTREEAAARCVDAVRDLAPDAMADPADITVDELYAGDRVEIPLLPNQSTMSGCYGVPGPIDPAADTNLPAGVAVDDTVAILTGCSATLRIDLQRWTVGAAMADGYGGIAATLVSPGQGYVVFCELQTSNDINGFQDVLIENHTSLPDLRNMTIEDRKPGIDGAEGAFDAHYSSCYPVITACVGESTSLTGVLPRGMESAAVVLADGNRIAVPVGPYGTFALRFVSTPGSDPHIHTFAASGAEIGSWPLRQPQQR